MVESSGQGIVDVGDAGFTPDGKQVLFSVTALSGQKALLGMPRVTAEKLILLLQTAIAGAEGVAGDEALRMTELPGEPLYRANSVRPYYPPKGDSVVLSFAGTDGPPRNIQVPQTLLRGLQRLCQSARTELARRRGR